ncbi:MAG: hypothetical protein L0271_14685 [Gemmatimonadetes bacterium]|nr:hypothetical protein [Gemmatimonadota bacterium]
MQTDERPPDHTGGLRWFTCDGIAWGAWLAGEGAGGTGFLAIRAWEAVHFCREDQPGVPVRESLLAHGRFDALFDEELCDLLRNATDIVLPERPAPETGA